MRKILYLWALTIFIFWGWHFASLYDTGPSFVFSLKFHQHIYQVYGNILHMPPADVPLAIAWLFFVDTLIVLGIAALRWYKHWLPQTWTWLRNKVSLAREEQGEEVPSIYSDLQPQTSRIATATPEVKDFATGQVHPAE